MINELKEKFLENNGDYSNDVKNFINYFDSEVGKGSFYSEFTIGGMNTKVIIKSLEFNIENEIIKRKSVAKKYISAIGQLFEFILENSDIKNINLKNELGAPSSRKNSYTGQCMMFINNCNLLQDIAPNSALNSEDVDILLNWCNYQCEHMKNYKIITELEFKRIAAGICIKLMLLTGITYRVARSLSFKALDIPLNIITINDYRIRLPLNLSIEFREYKQICYKMKFNTEEGFLFVDYDGNQWGEKTPASGIPNFLNTVLGTTSITSIIKYGIKQLMLQDISDSVILKLTGASTNILNDCLQKENEESYDWFTYINSKIVRTDAYKKL